MNGQMEKEKQIEEMAKCCTYYCNGECCADVTNICDCDLMCEMFGVFVALNNAGYRKERQGEWISVEDRLPKNNLARVLVFLKDAEFTRPIGFNKIDTDRCIDGKWARWGEYVTHWQPLPQPPKMKGE